MKLFLRHVFIATLLFCFSVGPIEAFYRHGSALFAFPLVFTGNSNVTISAFDTSAGITVSRATCKTPCFIQVSAGNVDGSSNYTGITATGTTRPYEDLEFVWKFNDVAAGETFTRPTDGVTVNANTAQVSPDAAYVYRTSGTKTITLGIRGCASPPLTISGLCQAFTTTTISTTITVTDFAPSFEAWADSNAGGTNAGTQANPFNTVAAIQTFLGDTGTAHSNIALHVAQGSHFTGSATIHPWFNSAGTQTGMRIDSYVGAGGAGANPIFDITSGGSNPTFSLTNGGSSSPAPHSDIVISNINFTRTSTSSQFGQAVVQLVNGNSTAATHDVYFDNVQVNYQVDTASDGVDINTQPGAGVNLGSNYGFWNVAVNGLVTPGGNTNGNGGFLAVKDWFFIVGGSVTGAGASATFDHHYYPDVQTHGLYQWINFGQGPGRSYCLNINWDNANGTFAYVDFITISENSCGTASNPNSAAWDSSNNNNDPITTLYRNYVAQRNAEHDLPSHAHLFYNGKFATYRDNRAWNNTLNWFIPSSGQANVYQSQVYRNRVYENSSTTGFAISFVADSAIAGTFANGSALYTMPANTYRYTVGQPVVLSGASLPSPFVAGNTYFINSAPTLGTTVTFATTFGGSDIVAGANGSGSFVENWSVSPQVFTNNVIVDARATTAKMFSTVFSQMTASASTIDYNQYWSTTGATNLFQDGATAKSFAQWQVATFDAHGANTNPGWTVPITQWSDFGP